MKWCFTVAREYGVSSSDLLSFLGLGGSDSAPVVLPRMWDASAVYEKRKPLLREVADWVSFLGNSCLCCSCSHRNILHLLSLQLLRVNSITSRSSSFLFFSSPPCRPFLIRRIVLLHLHPLPIFFFLHLLFLLLPLSPFFPPPPFPFLPPPPLFPSPSSPSTFPPGSATSRLGDSKTI